MTTTQHAENRAPIARRNVRLLTAYEVFAGLVPFLAIWVVYLTDFRDLTLTQVGVMEGVFWGIKVVTEIPTGAFADRFGRKLTFIVGAVIEGLGIFLFAFAGSFVLLLGSYILWAGGGAFRSGNTEAFLYDTLAEVDETDDFTRVSGRIGAIAGVTGLFGVAAGGVVAGVIDLQVAVLIGVIPYVFALAVLLPMQEPRRGESGGGISYTETLKDAVRVLPRQPAGALHHPLRGHDQHRLHFGLPAAPAVLQLTRRPDCLVRHPADPAPPVVKRGARTSHTASTRRWGYGRTSAGRSLLRWWGSACSPSWTRSGRSPGSC